MCNKFIRTIFLVTTVLMFLNFEFVINERTNEEQKCTKFKKQVFEEEITFGFLYHGAPIDRRTVDHCHTYTPLIVGGRPADPKEFPHAARIGIRVPNEKTNWICGGTLLTARWVLTAAHCLETVNSEVNVVRLGELDFSDDKEDAKPKDYGIKDYIIHEEFESPKLYNDIGLIELDEDVIFDRYKHPACLPYNDGIDLKSFIAIGWGSKGFAEASSDILLKVKLDRFNSDICRKNLEDSDEEFPEGFSSDTQLCIGSDKIRDTCNGDSGGPLLVYHKDYPCMYHVVGITSASPAGCAVRNIGGIYTNVHHYLDWINKTMSK